MKLIISFILAASLFGGEAQPKPTGMTCEDSGRLKDAMITALQAELEKTKAMLDAQLRLAVDHVARPEDNAVRQFNALHQEINQTKCGGRGITPQGRCVAETEAQPKPR